MEGGAHRQNALFTLVTSFLASIIGIVVYFSLNFATISDTYSLMPGFVFNSLLTIAGIIVLYTVMLGTIGGVIGGVVRRSYADTTEIV
jgi:uncharacterized membrane protein (UPF0136 family)